MMVTGLRLNHWWLAVTKNSTLDYPFSPASHVVKRSTTTLTKHLLCKGDKVKPAGLPVSRRVAEFLLEIIYFLIEVKDGRDVLVIQHIDRAGICRSINAITAPTSEM